MLELGIARMDARFYNGVNEAKKKKHSEIMT